MSKGKNIECQPIKVNLVNVVWCGLMHHHEASIINSWSHVAFEFMPLKRYPHIQGVQRTYKNSVQNYIE